MMKKEYQHRERDKPYSAVIPVPPAKRVRPEIISMVNCNTCSSTCSNPFCFCRKVKGTTFLLKLKVNHL